MNVRRTLRHLLMPAWRVGQTFPPSLMAEIEEAIRVSETGHSGQICFAVEAALELAPLLRDESARERAIEVYSQLRVWDTEHNNGVLIYLLLADHDVEILVDRGLNTRVSHETLEAICQAMEAAFRAGQFRQGVLEGIAAIGARLATHFPPEGPGKNEVPNRPVVL